MLDIGTYQELLMKSPRFSRLLKDIHQQGDDFVNVSSHRRQTVISTSLSDKKHVDELSTFVVSNDKKMEGTVNWRIYLDYTRAGLGSVFGLFLLALTFIAHQVFAMFSNWWLATWSDDESFRYDISGNCTPKADDQVTQIRTMSKHQWNEHRNRKFFIYLSKVTLCRSITFKRVVFFYAWKSWLV